MPAFRRAVARCIDSAPVVTLASELAVLTFNRMSALVTDAPEPAARGGFDLPASRGDVVGASEGLGPSLRDKSVLCVGQAFGLLVVATFLYQWACPTLLGRTAGKGLTGLRITPRGAGAAARRAAAYTTADVAVYAVACVLLIEGRFALSVLVWAVAVALFLCNALPVPGPGRRSLAGRVAGTSVTEPGLSRPDAMRPVRTS